MRLAFLASLSLAALPGLGSGQTLLYQDSFDSQGGWTLQKPQGTKAGWDVDRSPVSAPFGSYRSWPYSLNYNNRLNYKGTAKPGKKATSPPIDLGVATGIPVLTFWCNNQSEEQVCLIVHEALEVRVRGAISGSSYVCMNDAYGYGSHCCGSPLQCPAGWHEHTMPLDRSFGVSTIEFSFRHDSLFGNNTAGWFIDDLEVRDHPAPITYCSAKLNSQGCTPQISYAGAPSATVPGPPGFTVTATQVVNNKDGIFFYGLGGQASIPFQGGTLCFATPRRRTPIVNSAGNPPPNDCSGGYTFNFTSWILSGKDPALVPGAVVDAQFWYRDLGSSFNVGLTDAIEFTILP